VPDRIAPSHLPPSAPAPPELPPLRERGSPSPPAERGLGGIAVSSSSVQAATA
jgi:hypothetical protein